MKIMTTVSGQTYEIDLNIDPDCERCFIARIDDHEARLELIERKPASLTLAINNEIKFFEFVKERARISEIVYRNRSYQAELKSPQQEALENLLEEFGAGLGGSASDPHMRAPMPGKILGISVKPGDQVELGQVVFVLEAMKMENEISSTVEGTVKAIEVELGATVNTGDVLLEVEPHR